MKVGYKLNDVLTIHDVGVRHDEISNPAARLNGKRFYAYVVIGELKFGTPLCHDSSSI